MPIYEYRCLSCEKTFEYMQRITEEPMRVCEACGGELERLISQTAFQLKGSGWYKDLYSSPKKESGGGDKSTGGGESKPAGGESKPSGGSDPGSGSGSGTGTGTGTGSGSGSGKASKGGSE